MLFRDIKLFTSKGTWECDFNLDGVLPQLDKWAREQGLNINPDFQRIHVWTEAQQIAYVEYILRGGMTGRTIYLNNPEWGRGWHRGDEFVLVDGKQRVEALRRFFNNEITAFGGLFSQYTDLPDFLRQGFKINVNNLGSRAEVLQWYLDMNTGGTPHTSEEIQKARELLVLEQEKEAVSK